MIKKMANCRVCGCTNYIAPNIIESMSQKLSGGAFLGCINCGHHANLH